MGRRKTGQDDGLRLSVAWLKVHTTATVKKKMTWQKRQIAIANHKADELAKRLDLFDGADFVSLTAKDACELRQRIHAAI